MKKPKPKPHKNGQDLCPKDHPDRDLWEFLLAGSRSGNPTKRSAQWRKQHSRMLRQSHLEYPWTEH